MITIISDHLVVFGRLVVLTSGNQKNVPSSALAAAVSSELESSELEASHARDADVTAAAATAASFTGTNSSPSRRQNLRPVTCGKQQVFQNRVHNAGSDTTWLHHTLKHSQRNHAERTATFLLGLALWLGARVSRRGANRPPRHRDRRHFRPAIPRSRSGPGARRNCAHCAPQASEGPALRSARNAASGPTVTRP